MWISLPRLMIDRDTIGYDKSKSYESKQLVKTQVFGSPKKLKTSTAKKCLAKCV